RRAAGSIALDDKDLGAFRRAQRAVGKLTWQPQAARRSLPADLFFLLAAKPLLSAVDHPLEQAIGLRRVAGKPMVEGIAHRGLDDAGRFLGRQPVLGLALELGLADEEREEGAAGGEHVLGRELRATLIAGELAIGAQALDQGGAQARFMCSAVWRRHRVAV